MDYNLALDNLPEGISKEAVICIARVAKNQIPEDTRIFATQLYKELAMEYKESGRWPAILEELHMQTSTDMLAAIDAYITLRNAQPETIPIEEEPEPDSVEESDDGLYATGSDTDVNDITLFLIDNVVKRTKITNRYDVLTQLCKILEYRFGDGSKLESGLEKLNLRTTKDILHAIDIYFIMKKLYPDTVFGRTRMYKVWGSAFDDCLQNVS